MAGWCELDGRVKASVWCTLMVTPVSDVMGHGTHAHNTIPPPHLHCIAFHVQTFCTYIHRCAKTAHGPCYMYLNEQGLSYKSFHVFTVERTIEWKMRN